LQLAAGGINPHGKGLGWLRATSPFQAFVTQTLSAKHFCNSQETFENGHSNISQTFAENILLKRS
jgi:hypothetical protein